MKLFKIAALSLFAATPLAAQTAVAVVEVEPYVHLFSDEGVTARLTESGYEDIAITRDGMDLKINATKDGAAHEMVYDMGTGTLKEVDGAGYSLGTPAGLAGSGEGSETTSN